ncbi:MAG: hypothetical protein JNK60_15100 [Acidobacteria bacterium]|nr:hypothetical protein [Acidobacteriota bacterium]
MDTRTFLARLGALTLTVLVPTASPALAQSRPAPTAPVSATPIPITQQPTGSVDPSQQTGTLPGLPGVSDPRGVATGPTPNSNTVPSPGYDVSGLVVAYEPGKSISLRASNGVVRTIGLPANLNVPPDLTNGRYATVRLQRRAKGPPAVLAVSMSQPPLLRIQKKS